MKRANYKCYRATGMYYDASFVERDGVLYKLKEGSYDWEMSDYNDFKNYISVENINIHKELPNFLIMALESQFNLE